MSDNIKVVVKVRPLIPREKEEKLPYRWRVRDDTLYQLDDNGIENGQSFTFEKVFDENSQTTNVYEDVAKPIVEAATKGINGTIFAYGQTSSGKTYTMSGTSNSPGIIPLVVKDLFSIMNKKEDRQFLIRVSYIEIYNEKIKDLLDVKNLNVKIHETESGLRTDAKEKVTSTPDEVIGIMKDGEVNRQIGSTNMNDESSRSHSIFQIIIESREISEEEGCVNVSHLNLVDLAGSERAKQTGATGIRFKEGTHINKSLSTLALVIKQLSEEPMKHANFRDSKLTRILQNSLGGNAKTSIICAVTPAALEETVLTLQFANRAKAVKNRPTVNAVATSATMIQKLTKQLSELQSQLEKMKDVKKDNRHLCQQILKMKQQFINGFNHLPADVSGSNRRKTWCATRRKTIDALPTVLEDASNIPRFCTPALKYNPLSMPGVSLLTVPNTTSKLSRVSEASSSGQITPPPREKKVGFNDDIIELDSDEEAQTSGACSPYHKCYASKTPPCVLREKAKKAEKNFNDIIELTEREKMYTPTVVELMDKLEQNTSVITKLEDQINELNEKCSQKDTQLEQMKDKIKASEDEIKNINVTKSELQTLCEEFTTKLTDMEFSYETLKNKSKHREQELLSLLEEQKTLTERHIGKPVQKCLDKDLNNFMNMSRDITLVGSDIENSIIDESKKPYDKLSEMQTEVNSKNEIIAALESELANYKEKVLSFEETNKELQTTVDELNAKATSLELDNFMLTSNMESMKTTIQTQKENLESANNDIASYDTMVKELQLKLNENFRKLNALEGDALDSMTAAEEQILANNDNIRNIIHSLKTLVEKKNNEIDTLKLESNSEVDSLKESLEVKTEQMQALTKELEEIKTDVLAKEQSIVALKESNTDLTHKNTEISEQLSELQLSLENEKRSHQEVSSRNNDLQQKYDELLKELEEKDNIITGFTNSDYKNKGIIELRQLYNSILTSVQKIKDYENDVDDSTEYDVLLRTMAECLDVLDATVDEYLQQKALLNEVTEIQNKHTRLSAQIEELTQAENNSRELYEKLQAQHSILSAEFAKVSAEFLSKTDEITTSSEIIETMKTTIEENAVFIDICKEKENQFTLEIENLTSKLERVEEKYDILKQEREALLNSRTFEVTQAENNSRELYENLQGQHTNLLAEFARVSAELQSKTDELTTSLEIIKTMKTTIEENAAFIEICKEKENQLMLEIENLRSKMQSLEENYDTLKQEHEASLNSRTSKYEEVTGTLATKDSEILELRTNLDNALEDLRDYKALNTKEISVKDELLANILESLTTLINNHGIVINIPSSESDPADSFKHVPSIFNDINEYLVERNSSYHETIKALETKLQESQSDLKQLKDRNDEISTELTQNHNDFEKCVSKLDSIQVENDVLSSNLAECNNLIESLKEEIVSKAKDLQAVEESAKNFKENLANFDESLNSRIEELLAENAALKQRSETESAALDVSVANIVETSQKIRKSLTNVLDEHNTNMPQSLISICCTKVIEALAVSDEDTLTPCSSTTKVEPNDTDLVKTEICQCENLAIQLRKSEEEAFSLRENIEDLKAANEQLTVEQEEAREEIINLVEASNHLQKVIFNHRTQLCTLTATTYLENKMLNTKIKYLQHHHKRCHNLCERDLPELKKQLSDLLTVLKSDSERGDSVQSHNTSFKRYSLPIILDNNTSVSTLKNESTLDGDLLMLDTNVTLTTSMDNINLTCNDMTQSYLENMDTSVYPENSSLLPALDHKSLEILVDDNERMSHSLETLKEENEKLKEQVQQYTSKCDKNTDINESIKLDVIEKEIHVPTVCPNCVDKQNIISELNRITSELEEVKAIKSDLETKVNDMSLEILATENLIKKLNSLDREYNIAMEQVAKLKLDVNAKNKELKLLQEENDRFSDQIMDNVTEVDDLRKELDFVKSENIDLDTKCQGLEKILKEIVQQTDNKESKLNLSQKDGNTSLRCNKIHTLQNELHASGEDCKKLTEEFATIRNQLDSSNISISQNMVLDEMVEEPSIFALTKNFESVATSSMRRLSMTNIPEEKSADLYSLDKMDCINYYLEKTGSDKENFNYDTKIVDIMKSLYNSIILKHGNEVQNLSNKLKDFEDSRHNLETQLAVATSNYGQVCEELERHLNTVKSLSEFADDVKSNLCALSNHMTSAACDGETNTKLVAMFKENILSHLDSKLTLSTSNIFESLIDSIVSKHQKDLSTITDQYKKLLDHAEGIATELSAVNDNVEQMKIQLTDKENEYNLLKTQKERMHEISSAVTRDIVIKEQKLSQTVMLGCKTLVDNNIMSPEEFDTNLPLCEKVSVLFEKLVTQCKANMNISELEDERKRLSLELESSKAILSEKEKELQLVNSQCVDLRNAHESLTTELQKHREQMVDINNRLEAKTSENISHVQQVSILQDELIRLKTDLCKKEETIYNLQVEITESIQVNEKLQQQSNAMESLQNMQAENEWLKSVNEKLRQESEELKMQLENSHALIQSNKEEFNKMSAQVHDLQQSLKMHVTTIQSLNTEMVVLNEQNQSNVAKMQEMQSQLNEKTEMCDTLNMNTKLHMKTVEIQSKMVYKLESEKVELCNEVKVKDKALEQLKTELNTARKELESAKNDVNILKTKEELRINELEEGEKTDNKKNRMSSEFVSNSRRRRQSLLDANRMGNDEKFGEELHNKMEEMFSSRQKPDDLFCDADDTNSGRNTPIDKRRDSLFAKGDLSDKEEIPSRPSSVAATRRRRQSIHDSLRKVNTPSPRESINKEDSKSSDMCEADWEILRLKEELTSRQQEIEELRERNKELDEECETCAEYLRDRDKECLQLQKEKAALEKTIAELKVKVGKINPDLSRGTTSSLCDAAVNTDEDWANLHSVVVDRMSFDAEVEKNKKLTRAIEEFRSKNRDLKASLANMQKALEKQTNKDGCLRELEKTKQELASCRQELAEQHQRYKELDEECETCAERLREQDEQCYKLWDIKATLEAKIQELSGNKDSQTHRKKRQSLHDQHREPNTTLVDATTNTNEDLNYDAERDLTAQSTADDTQSREIMALKMSIERLTRAKAALEQQLSTEASSRVTSGSGIVQTQQLSDLMKENQKLKKMNAKLINIYQKTKQAHSTDKGAISEQS